LSYIRRGIAEKSAQTDHGKQNPQLSSGPVSRGWASYLRLTVLVISLLGAIAFLFGHFFSPSFVTEYEDMRQVPLSAIQGSLGVPLNPATTSASTTLLRVSVHNNSRSTAAQNTTLVIADYIVGLNAVLDQMGKRILQYRLTHTGNSSRLELPLGNVDSGDQRDIFIVCKCSYLAFADIYAYSSTLGVSSSRAIGDLSGPGLFIGRNAALIGMLLLTVLCIIIILIPRKSQS
jgi:hypothetical protein